MLSNDQVEGLLKALGNDAEGHLNSLKNVILLDKAKQEVVSQLKMKGLLIYTFEELFSAVEPKENHEDSKVNFAGQIIDTFEEYRCEPDDVFMLCYTSGTTGRPKGVKFTHDMFVNQTYAMSVYFQNAADRIREDDVYISRMPSAHSFEQSAFFLFMMVGGRIGFKNDEEFVKPTVVFGTPHFYN